MPTELKNLLRNKLLETTLLLENFQSITRHSTTVELTDTQRFKKNLARYLLQAFVPERFRKRCAFLKRQVQARFFWLAFETCILLASPEAYLLQQNKNRKTLK